MAGFASLLLAALFFMALVIAGTYGASVPCNVRPFSHFVFAILVATGSAFLGGWAKAEGNLPIFGKLHPITFSAGGGAAIFLITLLLANRLDPQLAPCEISRVVLTVGLTSSGGEVIASVIREHQAELLAGTGVDELSIETLPANDYEAARNDFRVKKKYDIVMVDDPWMPLFDDEVADLSKLNNYETLLGNGVLESSYFGSLLKVCRSRSNKLLGLPLTANVMVSFINTGAIPAKFGQAAAQKGLRVCPELSWVVDHSKELKTRNFDEPLGIRVDEPSNIVELFWLLMFSAGQSDHEVGGGPVEIDRSAARMALNWLRIAVPKVPPSGVTGEKLMEGFRNHRNVAIVGWANWASTVPDAGEQQELHVRPITSNASLLGAWILSIRNSSKNKEAALAVIQRICGDKDIQKSLALRGVTPVLQTIRNRDLLGSAFQKENYDEVRSLVEKASPRPRSKDWPRIETHLAEMIRSGLEDRGLDPFEEVPGLIRFVGR